MYFLKKGTGMWITISQKESNATPGNKFLAPKCQQGPTFKIKQESEFRYLI